MDCGDDFIRIHGKLADCLVGERKSEGHFALAVLLGQLCSEREGVLELALDAVRQSHDAQKKKDSSKKTIMDR